MGQWSIGGVDVSVDVDALNWQIRKLEEDHYQHDKELLDAQRKEEEEEQYSQREMLELSFMREDFKSEIKILQLIDQQNDMLHKVKRERADYLYNIDVERRTKKLKSEAQVDGLREKIRREVSRNDD